MFVSFIFIVLFVQSKLSWQHKSYDVCCWLKGITFSPNIFENIRPPIVINAASTRINIRNMKIVFITISKKNFKRIFKIQHSQRFCGLFCLPPAYMPFHLGNAGVTPWWRDGTVTETRQKRWLCCNFNQK